MFSKAVSPQLKKTDHRVICTPLEKAELGFCKLLQVASEAFLKAFLTHPILETLKILEQGEEAAYHSEHALNVEQSHELTD